MDTNTALGRMFTGLAIKLIGAGIAIWVAVSAASAISAAFAKTSAAFEQVQNATEARQ